MDTLGPFISVTIFHLYDKNTITECVDYAGVFVFKCPLVNRFHCVFICNDSLPSNMYVLVTKGEFDIALTLTFVLFTHPRFFTRLLLG